MRYAHAALPMSRFVTMMPPRYELRAYDDASLLSLFAADYFVFVICLYMLLLFFMNTLRRIEYATPLPLRGAADITLFSVAFSYCCYAVTHMLFSDCRYLHAACYADISPRRCCAVATRAMLSP